MIYELATLSEGLLALASLADVALNWMKGDVNGGQLLGLWQSDIGPIGKVTSAIANSEPVQIRRRHIHPNMDVNWGHHSTPIDIEIALKGSYAVSYRDLEETLADHDIAIDHVQSSHWVSKFATLLAARGQVRKRLPAANIQQSVQPRCEGADPCAVAARGFQITYRHFAGRGIGIRLRHRSDVGAHPIQIVTRRGLSVGGLDRQRHPVPAMLPRQKHEVFQRVELVAV